MALPIPVTTLLTASANTMTAYMTALRAHMGSSTLFDIKANTPDDDGFTLVPKDGSQVFEINYRRTTSLVAQVSIDPLQNITNSGDTGTPPTLPDASEWSGEASSWDVLGSGAESLDFYVLEFFDAVIILMMNAAETAVPRANAAGRLIVPYFNNGVNGDLYNDGLAVFGTTPTFTGSGFGSTEWLNGNGSKSLIRKHQTGWAMAYGIGPSSVVGRIQNRERIRPIRVFVLADSGRSELGFTKYWGYRRVSQPPGTLLDAGVGKDAWVSVFPTDTSNVLVMPWDRTVSPAF